MSAADLGSEGGGESVPIDAAFLAGVEPGNFVTARLNERDVLVVARGGEGIGVGVFVRRDGRWRGYGLSSASGIQAVYQSPDGSVFAWAYNGSGGPPSGYSAFHVGDQPGQQFCTELVPPEELNRSLSEPYEWDWRGEYFDFGTFNVDLAGVGTIVGSAEVLERADADPVRVTYRYTSHDGGRTWAAPERIDDPENPDGVYNRLETADEAVFAELRDAVG